MDVSNQRPWTPEEEARLLSQEEVDQLEPGTTVLFKNSLGHGPELNRIGGRKGDYSKNYRDTAPCAFLSTPCEDWLYNVGKTAGFQQVVVVEDRPLPKKPTGKAP